MTTETRDTRLKRLKFRAWHRGTKEMDLILGQYYDEFHHEFTDDQLDQFEAILEAPDTDMFQWVSGRKPTPEEHDSPLWQMIVAHWRNRPSR